MSRHRNPEDVYRGKPDVAMPLFETLEPTEKPDIKKLISKRLKTFVDKARGKVGKETAKGNKFKFVTFSSSSDQGVPVPRPSPMQAGLGAAGEGAGVPFLPQECAVEVPLQGDEAAGARVERGRVASTAEARAFQIAHTRNGMPQTSFAAAASVRGINRTQQAVIAILRQFGPQTDEQIWMDYEREWIWKGASITASPSGLRSRRAELVRLGLVEDSGATAKISTGRFAIVWRLK